MKECPACHVGMITLTGGSASCMSCGWSGPKCFGDLYDARNPKCVGGPDPSYWEKGTHVRPPCSSADECSTRCASPRPWKEVAISEPKKLPILQRKPMTGAQSLYSQQQPAAAQHLHAQHTGQPPQVQYSHSQVPSVQPQHQVTPYAPQYPQHQVTPYAPQYPCPPPPQYSPYPQGIEQYSPHHHEQFHMHAQYRMYVQQCQNQQWYQAPIELAIPEPMGVSIARTFLSTVLRAALAGAFHTAANFLDYNPWGSAGRRAR